MCATGGTCGNVPLGIQNVCLKSGYTIDTTRARYTYYATGATRPLCYYSNSITCPSSLTAVSWGTQIAGSCLPTATATVYSYVYSTYHCE